MPPGKGGRNPYRPDLPAGALFTGREAELRRLRDGLTVGTPGVIAVMGGRGMGKTSLARAAETHARTSVDVGFVPRPRDPGDVLASLSQLLGGDLHERMLPRSIEERAVGLERPVALLIDEVEGLLEHERGPDLLENLRVAREAPRVENLLRIVVLGGSKLRELLQSELSPFLRSAHWLPVRGFDVVECRDIVCKPLSVDVEDKVVRRLWHSTGGHPLLLQRVLHRAVDLGWPAADALARAEEETGRQQGPLFEVLWRNLQAEGQAAYQRLVEGGPLPRAERLERLGNNPDAIVEVLASTGVVWVGSDDAVRVHGHMFERWVRDNHAPPGDLARGGSGGDNTPFLTRVRGVLCRLVTDVRVVEMLARDSTLQAERVDFKGPLEQVWRGVLEEAERADALSALLRVVATRYPRDREVPRLLKEAEHRR